MYAASLAIAAATHGAAADNSLAGNRRVRGGLSRQQDKLLCQYIKNNIGSDLSVVDLANLLQLSPGYFCKAFAKTKGVTPHKFVLNERVSTALERLRRQPASSLARLAYELGFANQAHFSNVFRNKVGCSPSQFISSQRYNQSGRGGSNPLCWSPNRTMQMRRLSQRDI
jgi:AraC-like DNA-binding protein